MFSSVVIVGSISVNASHVHSLHKCAINRHYHFMLWHVSFDLAFRSIPCIWYFVCMQNVTQCGPKYWKVFKSS